jgi:hypothetical protein
MTAPDHLAQTKRNILRRRASTNKPIGSGIFAAVVGAAFVLFNWFGPDISTVNRTTVFKYWVFFAGGVLGIWGLIRIVTTSATKDIRIGQDTVNLVIAIFAATFAILALVASHGP